MIIKEKESIVELDSLVAGTVFRLLNEEEFYMKTDELDEVSNRDVIVTVCLSDGVICRISPDYKVIPCPNATLIY